MAPPWLAKLQAQVARVEGEVVDLRGSLAESRTEQSSSSESALQARPVSPDGKRRPAGGDRRGAAAAPPRRRPLDRRGAEGGACEATS